MRLKESLAPLSAAVLLTGCAANTHAQISMAEHPKTPPSTIQSNKNLTKAEKWTLDMQRTLNDFRNMVLIKHEARLALGMCVGWPSYLSDGEPATNVTLNLGIAESEGREYYIFSTHDPRFNPSWGPLNGPEFLSPDAEIVLMTTQNYINAKTPRKLLPEEEKDKTGQRYFEDYKTNEPVLDTAVIPGNLSVRGVKNACIELSKHKILTKIHKT